MNRSKIEWCDYTWNPVTGCLHGCEFCYARRIDKRFGDGSFTPTLHYNRLKEPLAVKKPSRIFIGSMADLFGEWAWEDANPLSGAKYHRNEVMRHIFETVIACPQHTFIFLTKNPKGMQGFYFPDNCWCGTSVENQEKANERREELRKVNCRTLFVSYEPALGPVDFSEWFLSPGWSPTYINPDNANCEPSREPTNEFIKWLIIGAQTGPGAVEPNPEWINSAVKQAVCSNVPLFVKDNVRWPEQIRQWPEGR